MDTDIQRFEHALRVGDTETISRLFDQVRNNVDMFNQLLFATRFGDLSVVKCLHEHGVNINRTMTVTPLMVAAIHGHVDIIDYLLSSDLNPKTNVNIKNIDGWTALMYACYYGKVDVVDRLLDVGDCDINCKNLYGNSPLSIAVERNYIEIVDKLIIHGANYYEERGHGYSLLHLAVSQNYQEMVLRIISLGVDINKQNNDGNTPLMIAARLRSHKNIVKILMDNGADVTIKNKFGEAPIDYSS